jgi:DNA-binding response OmpR family regulator
MLIRMMVVEAMEELGYRVEQAANAAHALKKVRLASGGIDAAIIDVGLPDRQGDSLAAELRAMHAQMRIIIATGYDDTELRRCFAGDALVSFLSKPYEAVGLASQLRAAGVRPPHVDQA